MKKTLLSASLYMLFSFFLSGLQGSLYFFPIYIPCFWIIIFTYYSLRKDLLFSLLLNLVHGFVLLSFSTYSLSRLLLLMNAITVVFYLLKERFHINMSYMVLAAGAANFIFYMSSWIIDSYFFALRWPQLLNWTGKSLMTMLFAPVLILIFEKIEKRIQTERIDTLENLRV